MLRHCVNFVHMGAQFVHDCHLYICKMGFSVYSSVGVSTLSVASTICWPLVIMAFTIQVSSRV